MATKNPPVREAAQPNQVIGEMLKAVPLLAKLTADERAKLGGCLRLCQFQDSQAIITQGQQGNGFYIIQSGLVIVTRVNPETKEVSELGRLGPGDFFGEAALLTNAPRGASVIAHGPVSCFYLDRSNFNELFGPDRLNVQFAKRQGISSENFPQKNRTLPPSKAQRHKSPEVLALILKAVRDNVLFMNLDSEHISQIVDCMYRSEVKKGVSAITQGEWGDNLYVVESGEFHVFVNGNKVATRAKGSLFGELALMYNSPRAATVTAVEDSVVWVVDRFTFRRIVTDLSEKKFSLYVAFLKNVQLLAPLAEYERRKIAEALEEVSYPAGHTIFRQGDEGDTMFLIHSGSVVCTKKTEEGKEEELCRLGSGEYFGERALMKNEARAATVTTKTKVLLLRLDRNAFSLLLGPLEDILTKKVASYEAKSPATPEPQEKPIHFSDLRLIGTLGKGSFGHVQLVVDKTTNHTYALKSVNKAQIVATGQQAHIMSEKRVMAILHHPFLVKLHATYKDRHRLFFLLEPSLGGELFSLLREKTLFEESTARFYAGCVVLAFEYMHRHNVVYRDLKPENLLLDPHGYLKITDFGFAKDISSGRTWTLCGTPDYLAPEIVAGKGHSKGVDWWTLGIFIYEMLASYPPFYDEDPMRTYAKIMQGNITYPSHFSKEAVDLIGQLLQPKTTTRLGVLKGGADLIKSHEWFTGFDWDALIKKKLVAPYIPKLKNDRDLSNFETYPDEGDGIQPYEDDGSNWDHDF